MTIARAPTATAAGAKMTCAWAATEAATITTGAQASRPDMSGHAQAMDALNHNSPIHGVQTGLKSNCGSAQHRATTPAATTRPPVGPLRALAAAMITPSAITASPTDATNAPYLGFACTGTAMNHDRTGPGAKTACPDGL